MFGEFISFVLRLLLVISTWVFVWKVFRPKTQLGRVLRLVVLLLLFGMFYLFLRE